MRIAFVVGPCPPGQCGIGDYTACLAKSLRSIGVEASLIDWEDWSVLQALRTSRRLAVKFDIVHIQYPSLGFGRKLGPQGLSLLQNCIVTIHEASRATIKRRLSLIPFTLRAEHIIFTSSFERCFAIRWFPWIEGFSSVIPVGSNIASFQSMCPRVCSEIVYFGLIMPGNGLEQVIELSKLIKAAGLPLIIRVIGGVALKHLDYFYELQSKTAALPIVWDRDLSEEEIAERLARASIAYLPYPDGASERRTTLKAALVSGLGVVTTGGRHTPVELERVVKLSQSPEEALATIRFLMENPDELSTMSSKAVEYSLRYSWECISKGHLKLYDSVFDARKRLISRAGALS